MWQRFAHDYSYSFLCTEELYSNSVSESIKRIEEESFSGCNLSCIYIPDSIECIEKNAFDLTSVIICSYGSYADQWCQENNLTAILIPGSD